MRTCRCTVRSVAHSQPLTKTAPNLFKRRMPESLHQHLKVNELFARLPVEILARLEPGLSVTNLAAGEVLVKQGEPGDALFVLLDGVLEVSVRTGSGAEVTLDTLTPGASVGEMAIIAGQDRTATVTATRPARLIRLDRSHFSELAKASPELREALVREMEPRLQRVQLSSILQQWFPDLHADEVHDLQQSVRWLSLAGGEELYRQGDTADGMYLLVSGRLRTSVTNASGNTVSSAELGRGASIGEYSVLGEAPRSETVTAIRDSQLVRLDRQLVDRHPQVMAQIARNVLRRAHSAGRPAATAGVSTIALVPGHPGAPLKEVAALLQERLTGARVISAETVNRQFDGGQAAETERDGGLDAALTHWLNETEARFSHTLLLTDHHPGNWTKRCLGRADEVLIVASSDADAEPGSVERLLAEREASNVQLLLVHAAHTALPQGTARWLDARPPLPHHHLRLNHAGDADRLVRRLSGSAIGLTLSGGGARGYVHIGLIRALQELHLPVDMVIGTSMGALVGGVYAHTLDYEACYRNAAKFGDPKLLLDKTLPLVALAESRNVTEAMRSMFGTIQIEDLWIPYACVSANLTRAEPVIHDRGPLWQAVRASTAIPGIFTPVTRDGDVLVDGGILNNYPVDIMRERISSGVVIGSNAESTSRNRAFDFGPSLSGWRLLLERFMPQAKRTRYPTILSTLMRSTSISSRYHGAAADQLADISLRYPVQDFGNLEFHRHQELSEIGYEVALPALRAWQDSRAT